MLGIAGPQPKQRDFSVLFLVQLCFIAMAIMEDFLPHITMTGRQRRTSVFYDTGELPPRVPTKDSVENDDDVEDSVDLEVPGIRAIYAFFRKRPTSALVSRAAGPAAPAAELHVKSLELGAVARPATPSSHALPSPLARRRRNLARRSLCSATPGVTADPKPQVELGPMLRLLPSPPAPRAGREGFPRRVGWAQVWNPEGRPQMKPVKLTLR
eukprot:s1165_g2.t1